MKNEKRRPAYHPGSYVEDAIDALGMTRHECAARLDMSDKDLSELIGGDRGLNAETARKLGAFFGTKPDVWVRLQNQYEMYVAEQAEEYGIESDRPFLDMLDYGYFRDLGIVPEAKGWKDRILRLREALRVVRLETLAKHDLLTLCRQSTPKEGPETIVPRNAWITIGLDLAARKVTPAFESAKLDEATRALRRLTVADDGVDHAAIEAILSPCGIAYVPLPDLAKANVNGVVKWIAGDRPSLLVNDRGKYMDIFWFSLFHELGHVRQMKRRVMIVDGQDEELERDADAFARDTLIPATAYAEFLRAGSISEAAVVAFADAIGIAPGIVVGRLQKEGRLPYSHLNGLRRKTSWKSSEPRTPMND
ncbi:MAG: HigA family addiction module antitoxin [Candidatus Izemoplasmatales bacterium]